MELGSIDYLLYKYPGNPITQFIIRLIYLEYGFNVPKDHDNLRVEWAPNSGEWYISLVLDGYDDEVIAVMTYISANDEPTLRFRVDDQQKQLTSIINVPLDTIVKVTEVAI